MKNRTLGTIAVALVIAAVGRELRKPAEQRTWHDRLFGFLPYDFRPPSLERIQAAYWNPDDDRLLTQQVFGVGWGINLYRVKELVAG